MDINYLYQRHQVSLFMSEHAGSQEARNAHREFADRYVARCGEARGRTAGVASSGVVPQARRKNTNRQRLDRARTVGDQFDRDARRIDPPSERR